MKTQKAAFFVLVCGAPAALCPKIFNPQCGINGVTYPNACERECASTSLAHPGVCTPEEECVGDCEWTFNPVCDDKGKTWGNMCELGCGGNGAAHPGPCTLEEAKAGLAPLGWTGPSLKDLNKWETVAAVLRSGEPRVCECPAVPAYVCGMDKKTYRNQCVRDCHDAREFHNGPCGEADIPSKREGVVNKECRCPRNISPVCGIDGQTYQNSCFLDCYGVAQLHDGTCWSKLNKESELS
ncbi:putative serine proteinase inhibitor PI-2 [Besnoitia besnoiti]|uniref:Putative serine proteinase inhibitor PI-2 n=1 Tax=Besnoitia besnoiti TaxID=94643 RepID=A0A2A9M823_BESBE|nr:putative serine proteinase inhibitor PI-2 [Besnoitia besnoiti]PFH31797.1 putative serine proteinase inhibitor PI-2 [Besnoitia besnoiti]